MHKGLKRAILMLAELKIYACLTDLEYSSQAN